MSTRQIELKDVPAIDFILERLSDIGPNLLVDRAGYEFDKAAYVLVIAGAGREGRVTIPRELLDDIRDNRLSSGSRYSQELHAKLSSRLRETVESNGLIAFSERALELKLLQFIEQKQKTEDHVEKYNTIGRDGQGNFERWLRTTLTREEKSSLAWLWNDLIRRRIIASTERDIVIPDAWVRVTDKGAAIIDGTTAIDYDAVDTFIPAGGVYTAYRIIQNIMGKAVSELLVIDPYVNEDLLDMFAALDGSVQIRVLSERLKGNFKLALRKLQQQRGGIEVRCSSQFHDRFILLDRQVCYQLGSSINHAGAKGMTIGQKTNAVRAASLLKRSACG